MGNICFIQKQPSDRKQTVRRLFFVYSKLRFDSKAFCLGGNFLDGFGKT